MVMLMQHSLQSANIISGFSFIHSSYLTMPLSQPCRKTSLRKRCFMVAKQQKTRFYIFGRCIAMLLCWHDHAISDQMLHFKLCSHGNFEFFLVGTLGIMLLLLPHSSRGRITRRGVGKWRVWFKNETGFVVRD